MQKTQWTRPKTCPRVNHLPSCCAWSHCSPAMNHIFFHSKHTTSTLKPLKSIQTRPILCNYSAATKWKQRALLSACMSFHSRCAGMLQTRIQNGQSQRQHTSTFTVGHKAKRWTPQLVKGAWSLQKGMSLQISSRKMTRLRANTPPNAKKMHD